MITVTHNADPGSCANCYATTYSNEASRRIVPYLVEIRIGSRSFTMTTSLCAECAQLLFDTLGQQLPSPKRPKGGLLSNPAPECDGAERCAKPWRNPMHSMDCSCQEPDDG